MRVCAWVRGWVRSHLAEVSKIVRTHPEPEHKHQGDHHNRNTSDHHKSSTRAGAPARTQRTRIEKEIKKTIANKFFFNFFVHTFAP